MGRISFHLIESLLWVGMLLQQPCNAELRRDEEYPPPELLAALRPIHDVCVRETGVAEEAIKEFSDGDLHEDRALKCYMDCMFRRTKMLDADGEVHLEKLYSALPPIVQQVYAPVGVKCVHSEGSDRCEKAFWFHKCWKTNDPRHYFLA